jgi:hypothetical protein
MSSFSDMKRFIAILLLSTSAAFGDGFVRPGGAGGSTNWIANTNGAGIGTLTLNNQYAYAPVTVVTTFQTNNMTTSGAGSPGADPSIYKYAGEYNSQQYATNATTGTYCLYQNGSTWVIEDGATPGTGSTIRQYDTDNSTWADGGLAPVTMTLTDDNGSTITTDYQEFRTDISSYSGIYSFAGTDVYGYQYATNANANMLRFSDGESWQICDVVGGSGIFWYNTVPGFWTTVTGQLYCGITGNAGANYVPFRTLTTNGAVSLPAEKWDLNQYSGSGTLPLNNNYQTLNWTDPGGLTALEIAGLSNTNTLRPRWTVLKISNTSGSSCDITFSYDTRHLNTAISTIANGKVAIISIYDDGLGNSDSIVTASIVEP